MSYSARFSSTTKLQTAMQKVKNQWNSLKSSEVVYIAFHMNLLPFTKRTQTATISIVAREIFQQHDDFFNQRKLFKHLPPLCMHTLGNKELWETSSVGQQIFGFQGLQFLIGQPKSSVKQGQNALRSLNRSKVVRNRRNRDRPESLSNGHILSLSYMLIQLFAELRIFVFDPWSISENSFIEDNVFFAASRNPWDTTEYLIECAGIDAILVIMNCKSLKNYWKYMSYAAYDRRIR